MNLSDYIQLPREQRIAHIDLTTPCTVYRKKAGWKAREALLTHFGIDETGRNINIHCCHLCECKEIGTCTNPLHMYWGTRVENERDKPPEQRSHAASIAALSKTPEQYRAASLKSAEAQTYEERSAAATKGKANMTAEARSEAVRKGWETRRRKQQGGFPYPEVRFTPLLF